MINQYILTWYDLPAIGEIRELVDRDGKVQQLAKVVGVDSTTRRATLEIMELDNNGIIISDSAS